MGKKIKKNNNLEKTDEDLHNQSIKKTQNFNDFSQPLQEDLIQSHENLDIQQILPGSNNPNLSEQGYYATYQNYTDIALNNPDYPLENRNPNYVVDVNVYENKEAGFNTVPDLPNVESQNLFVSNEVYYNMPQYHKENSSNNFYDPRSSSNIIIGKEYPQNDIPPIVQNQVLPNSEVPKPASKTIEKCKIEKFEKHDFNLDNEDYPKTVSKC